MIAAADKAELQLSLWALSRGGQRDGKGLLLPINTQKGPGFI